MDWVSAAANLIGAPSSHHQTEEAGPTGDYTENDNKAAATPSEAHPEMDTRRLVPKRGRADQPQAGTSGESSERTDKAIKIKVRRQDREQEDLIWRIHQETTEEEADEEPAKTLELRPKKRD